VTQRLDWQRISRQLAENRRALESGFRLDDRRMQQRLRERAAGLALRNADGAQSAPTQRLMVFALRQRRFALELDRIARVVRQETIVTVPGGPVGLLGIGNFDGEVCSVLNLAQILSLPEEDRAGGGYVLLLDGDGCPLGVSIDHVEQIQTHDREETTMTRDDVAEQISRYVKTVTREGLIVLDADALLQYGISPGPVVRSQETGVRGQGSGSGERDLIPVPRILTPDRPSRRLDLGPLNPDASLPSHTY